MDKQEMITMLLRGQVAEFNAWRKSNPEAKIDLNRADLSGKDLVGADFSRADLRGVDFYGANLFRTNFSGAKLYGAYLSGAKLLETKGLPAELQERIIADLKRSWK